MPIELPNEVEWQLDYIREQGWCNMFDRHCVIDVAEQCGFDAAAEWVQDADQETYVRLIREGPA